MYKCYSIVCIELKLKINFKDRYEQDDFFEEIFPSLLNKYNLHGVQCVSIYEDNYYTTIGSIVKTPCFDLNKIIENLQNFLKEPICNDMIPLKDSINNLLKLEAYTFADG